MNKYSNEITVHTELEVTPCYLHSMIHRTLIADIFCPIDNFFLDF